MTLYRANIRLSTEIFSILCLFEVTLRNAIDVHYRSKFGNNWLFDAVQPGTGHLNTVGCEKSLNSVTNIIASLGINYAHDKAIAELTFGFWTFQFACLNLQSARRPLHFITTPLQIATCTARAARSRLQLAGYADGPPRSRLQRERCKDQFA